MPIKDRLNKENVALMQNTYAAIKKNEIMFSAGSQLKLEAIILSKLTKEKKIKHCTCLLVSGS